MRACSSGAMVLEAFGLLHPQTIKKKKGVSTPIPLVRDVSPPYHLSLWESSGKTQAYAAWLLLVATAPLLVPHLATTYR